jgi:hypothetical protein
MKFVRKVGAFALTLKFNIGVAALLSVLFILK